MYAVFIHPSNIFVSKGYFEFRWITFPAALWYSYYVWNPIGYQKQTIILNEQLVCFEAKYKALLKRLRIY